VVGTDTYRSRHSSVAAVAVGTGSGTDSTHITKQQLQSKRSSTSGSADSNNTATTSNSHGEMSQIEYAVLAAEHNAELQKAARKPSRVSAYHTILFVRFVPCVCIHLVQLCGMRYLTCIDTCSAVVCVLCLTLTLRCTILCVLDR
jgi:hypothetical protein